MSSAASWELQCLSSSGGGWQLILRGTGRVKVLEIDFLPRCKGTTRNNMELSAHVSHLLSFRSEASEWGGKRGFLDEASGSWKRERWTEETTRAPAGWTRGQWIFWHFYPQATNWFGLIHVNSQVSHVPVSLLGSAGQPPWDDWRAPETHGPTLTKASKHPQGGEAL